MVKRCLLALLIVFAACTAVSTPSSANTGHVLVKVGKAGLIVGAGAGHGVLTFHGRDHRFRIYGLTLGFSAGISTSRLKGLVSELHQLRDFAGVYDAVAVGGAWVLGGASVRLKNDKGVIITLQGERAGLELTANLSKISIAFE